MLAPEIEMGSHRRIGGCARRDQTLDLPVFNAYRNQFGPNLFSAYLPTDLQDAARYLRDKSRWR